MYIESSIVIIMFKVQATVAMTVNYDCNMFIELSITIIIMFILQAKGPMIVNYNHNTFMVQAFGEAF